MNWANTSKKKPARWPLTTLIMLAFLLAIGQIAYGTPLLLEHFDQKVGNDSPIGLAPDWHCWAVKDGRVTDFTTAVPEKENYPVIDHTYGGAKSGPWQWSIGFLTIPSFAVSNVLIWVDTTTALRSHPPAGFSYFSRNDSPDSSTRIAVRVGGRWYVSTTLFYDPGKADWVLNALPFKLLPEHWQLLNTNTLAPDGPCVSRIPKDDVSAVGVYCRVSGWGRARLDEFQIVGRLEFDPAYQVGSWIWAEHRVDRKLCRFWKLIEIPPDFKVKRAQLRITAHDAFRAYLDGNDFGLGSDWTSLSEYDLKKVLSPGRHVLAVEAFNEYEWAGLVAGLVVEATDGRKLQFATDDSWRIVPEDAKSWKTQENPSAVWPPATVLFPYRDAPGLPNPPKVNPASELQPIVVHFWQQAWFQVTLLSFCVALAAICVRLLAKVALQSKEQMVLQRERARIARDIHDDLGAVVTQLVLQGETAQSELAGNTEMRAKFKRISETGRRLVQSVNEVVWMVNSQRDSLQDFENYVCRYTESFLRVSGIRCRLDVDGEIPEAEFDLARRRGLFLAIKEALNNAAKHSGATEVLMKIHIEQDEVTVTVEDNGKGFDPVAADRSRNGLSNMAHRMAEVGGQCRVTSQPGGGCRVELTAHVSHLPHKHNFWRRRKI